jgi:3-isopropylmalate dehydratase small subunit
LLGITISDEEFYEVAVEGREISIDLERRRVTVDGKEWEFRLSQMEQKLIETGGITAAFRKFGKRLFEVLCKGMEGGEKPLVGEAGCESIKDLQW